MSDAIRQFILSTITTLPPDEAADAIIKKIGPKPLVWEDAALLGAPGQTAGNYGFFKYPSELVPTWLCNFADGSNSLEDTEAAAKAACEAHHAAAHWVRIWGEE